MGGAVVTGAARGLGLAIAGRLVARDMEVELTDIDGEGAAAAAQRIGGGARGGLLDVRDAEACDRVARQVEERSGSLEVWVNNAGLLLTGRIHEQDLEAQRRMLDVNAIGTFNGTRAALDRMLPAGRGHIINVISLAGLVAAPGEGAYAASKHAAIAYSLAALADLRGQGIGDLHISCVCPDGVWSPMIADKLDDPNAAPSFSGKMLLPEQVAARTVKLLDRPRPVVTIPRRRGALVRFYDRWPRLLMRLVPFALRDARRRQRRFKRRVESGRWPPS